jgi:dsRNA-specific ribonuclease
MDVLFAAMAAYVGRKALAAITREWGIDFTAEPGGEVDPGLLQFKRTPPGLNPHEITSMEGTGRNDKGMHWRRGISSRIIYDDEFGDLRYTNTDSTSLSPTTAATTATDANLDPKNFLAPCTTAEDASAQFVRALLAAIQMHAGKHSAKRFYTQHFLSRTLDLASIFDFKYPTRDLSRLCLREGFEAPVARLISETGRLSRHPVFVVGVYSGRDKLGEGVGASLDEARVRASAAALKGWYLYSPMDVVVPSEVEDGEGKERWKPNMVDCGEIIT